MWFSLKLVLVSENQTFTQQSTVNSCNLFYGNTCIEDFLDVCFLCTCNKDNQISCRHIDDVYVTIF